MKRTVAMVLIFSLMAVSSLPLLSAGSNVQAASYCPLCHMNSHMKMASTDHSIHMMTPAMRHARIEYCGHHDIDTLPHLLAPHVVPLANFDAGLIISDVATANLPVPKPRLLPFPVPPPKVS